MAQDEIDTQAAEWAARLGDGPLSEGASRALARWLEHDPRHRLAFSEARMTWGLMGDLRHQPGALAMDMAPPRRAVRTRQGRLPWVQSMALAASVLLAAAWGLQAFPVLTADHRTTQGEVRDVTLGDGSVVTLGPESAVAIHFDETARRVELLSGQAYFVAAPRTGNEGRPFVVEAGGGSARALGTQFMVNRLPNAVEVTVAEHKVEVSSARDQVVLSPGQSVRYGREGLALAHAAQVDMAAAWRAGTLVFDHQPLAEVVAQLNRYRHDRIVIVDGDLAGRTVSGVFDTADSQATLDTIVRVLNIRSTAIPPLVTLLY